MHESSITIKQDSELSDEEKHFVSTWISEYFGEFSEGRDLRQAPVHWRILGRCDDTLVCHAAISRMKVSINGESPTCMAIGGLFTHSEFEGRGFGNKAMDAAERFIFDDNGADLTLLFCLDSLRRFYAHRGWQVVTEPVLLEQPDKWVEWTETAMVSTSDGRKWSQAQIRVHA